jgi:hypothetical protein
LGEGVVDPKGIRFLTRCPIFTFERE